MKLTKEATQLGRRFDAWRQFEWILGLVVLLSSCFTVSVVVFLRRNFGERYLGIANLLFGYTIVANFAFLGNFIGVAAGHSFSFLMTGCWVAFIAASIFHRLEIARKNRKGLQWHSQCMGESLIPLPFSEEVVFKFIEPLLVLLVGVVFLKLSLVVGLWLVVCAVSLLVNNHLVFYFQRQVLLDIRDAGIEARNLGKALAGRPARETNGYVIAGSDIQLVKQDAGLQEAFASLSPELKGIFEVPGAAA